MSNYLFSVYFCASYIIPLIFLAIDINSYGYLVHLVSIFTFVYALILLNNRSGAVFYLKYRIKKYILVLIILMLLQLFFVPIHDIAKQIYLFSSYWSLWYIFKNKKIRSDVLMNWILIAAPISVILTYIGINPPADVSKFSPVRLIPVAEEGWRINFGPPGSNIHFTSTIAGLGLVLVLHSILTFGLNKKNFFMVLLMSYMAAFSGSRAVYIGVILSLCVIVYYVYFKNKKNYFIYFNFLILFFGIIIIFSSETLLLNLGLIVNNEIIASFTKSQISDPTAGRAGLWLLHISTFISYPFGGGSNYLKNFNVGDLLDSGQVLAASSESFFTYLIAVYGVWSLIIFGFYFFILKKLSQAGDYLKCALFIFALISTAASSLFAGSYGMGVWLIVPLLSAKILKV